MQINNIQNHSAKTNFKAKFIIDKNNYLNNLCKNYTITQRANALLDKFEAIGKNQELEIVAFNHLRHNFDDIAINKNIIEIFNRFTGKSMTVHHDPKKLPLWEELLSKLTKDESFYKLDSVESEFWNRITGQNKFIQ